MQRWKLSRMDSQAHGVHVTNRGIIPYSLDVDIRSSSPVQKRRAPPEFPSTPTKYGRLSFDSSTASSPETSLSFRRVASSMELLNNENKENSENCLFFSSSLTRGDVTPDSNTDDDEKQDKTHNYPDTKKVSETPPTSFQSHEDHHKYSWNFDTDERLFNAVKKYGEGQWENIATFVHSNFTPAQVKSRWSKICPVVKGPWRKEEDSILARQVEEVGTERWAQIATFIPGRSGKQCRERWRNHLDPTLRKDSWSEQDDSDLMEAQRCLGNKWSEIGKLLGGRAENAVKNRFNSLKARHRLYRSRILETGRSKHTKIKPKRSGNKSLASKLSTRSITR